jgi:hypothetical protein
MALNDFQITALLTEWEKSEDEFENSEDENDFDTNEVQNTLENVKFIDINNLLIEITNIDGRFVNIPLGYDSMEPCSSTSTFDENVNNIGINKNTLSHNSRSLRSHIDSTNITSHLVSTISKSQTSQGPVPPPSINYPVPTNTHIPRVRVQHTQKPINLK